MWTCLWEAASHRTEGEGPGWGWLEKRASAANLSCAEEPWLLRGQGLRASG